MVNLCLRKRLEAAQNYGYRLAEEIATIEINLTLAEEKAEGNTFIAFVKVENVRQQLEQSYKTARLFSIFTPDAGISATETLNQQQKRFENLVLLLKENMTFTVMLQGDLEGSVTQNIQHLLEEKGFTVDQLDAAFSIIRNNIFY